MAAPAWQLNVVNNGTAKTTLRGNIPGVAPNNRILQLENLSTAADAVTLAVIGHTSGGAGALRVTNDGNNGRGLVSLANRAIYAETTAVTGDRRAVDAHTSSPDGYAGFFQNETAGTGTSGIGLVALGRGHSLIDTGIGGDGFDGAIEAAGPNGIEGNSTTPGGYGVTGDAPAFGVLGTATDAAGTGVRGTGGATGTGVVGAGGTTGVSATGSTDGVVATGGANGVDATGGNFGVDSAVTNAGAVGVRSTAGSSSNDAVQGNTSSSTGDAVQGITSGASAFGMFAIPSGGGTGVVSSSGPGVGMAASNASAANATVTSSNSASGGTAGAFTGAVALRVRPNSQIGTTGLDANMTGDANGDANAGNDAANAIFASSDDTNNSAVITANTLPAPTCDELSCEAIETSGFVDVNGNARVTGTLTKGAGAFEIDDPLDPANYYLRHSFVESPDMKNIYDGIVTTDDQGEATVTLPVYFGALNKDFRYQLTAIGSFSRLMVSREIPADGRRFEIRSEEPNVKVSWQVTGIRDDAYARANPIVVRERKTGEAAGSYLHPDLFGHPNATPLGLDPAKPPAGEARTLRAQEALERLIAEKAKEARAEAAAAQSQSPPAAPKPMDEQ